jgi:hypothetical protein
VFPPTVAVAILPARRMHAWRNCPAIGINPGHRYQPPAIGINQRVPLHLRANRRQDDVAVRCDAT